MPKKGAPQSDAEEEPAVILKPVFGLQPTQYLPWLLGGIGIVLLFLVLILPGILNPGSQVTFTSSPDGAAVYIEGTRAGATPVTDFIPAGTYELRVSHPFHSTVRREVRVGGRLFGSLMVSRKQHVDVSLELNDGRALMADAAGRFSAWALAGDQHGQYQYPPVLSTAVTALYASADLSATATEGAGSDHVNTELGDAPASVSREHNIAGPVLETAISDVHTTAALKDFLRAFLVDSARGSTLSPFTFARAAQEVASAFSERPGLTYAVSAALPDNIDRQLRGTHWYEEFTGDYVTAYIPFTSESAGFNGFEINRVAGYRFIRVPGGRYVQGLAQFESPLIDPPDHQPPIVREVAPFLMLDREVTRELYLRFVTARPQWSRSNLAQLRENDRVDEQYLSWRESGGDTALPVSHVSYHAANAFAEWFEELLPPELQGSDVRLPTESEWEWAARAVSATIEDSVFKDRGVSGPAALTVNRSPRAPIADLLGNVWEWTSSWYHPAAYAAAPKTGADGKVVSTEAFDMSPGAQRVVRGGSWVNPPGSVGVVTRGAQPAEASTPFLGFRIVIVEPSNG